MSATLGRGGPCQNQKLLSYFSSHFQQQDQEALLIGDVHTVAQPASILVLLQQERDLAQVPFFYFSITERDQREDRNGSQKVFLWWSRHARRVWGQKANGWGPIPQQMKKRYPMAGKERSLLIHCQKEPLCFLPFLFCQAPRTCFVAGKRCRHNQQHCNVGTYSGQKTSSGL